MGRPRRTKKDSTQSEIISGARELGMVVWDLSDLGGHVLDAVAFWNGIVIPIEIKAPGKLDDLTEKEAESIRMLSRVGVDVAVVDSVEKLVRMFENIAKWR